MKIGYARVSTEGQDLSLQLDELRLFGCDKIFSEKVSSRSDMPERDKAISLLDEGDYLVVWKLDRLARSTLSLLQYIDMLMSKGVHFVSIKDSIDTSSASGRFQLAVFAALAELERDIIRERTIAGLEAARMRGRFGGRPKGMSKSTRQRCEAARGLVVYGRASIEEACRTHKISKTSYYKFLKEDSSL